MNTIRTFSRLANALAVSAILAVGTRAVAADYTVSIEYWNLSNPFRYNPSSLTIQAGDTVTWVNQDYAMYAYHSVYFPSSGAYSGPLDVDESISCQFTSPGSYSYFDFYVYSQAGIYYSGTVEVLPATSSPPPASLQNASIQPGGSFQCTLSNLTVGQTYVIEMSTNLLNWSGIYTNKASSSLEPYVDNGAKRGGCGFYRVVYYQ